MKTIDRHMGAQTYRWSAMQQLIGALAIFCALAVVSSARAADCTSLMGRKAAFGVVVKARHFAAGEKVGAGPHAWAAPRAFCSVEARLTPATGSDIQVELWLPDAAGWNGKLLGGGNGGFGGNFFLPHLEMLPALRRGYAAAGTDMGHESPGPFGPMTARWAYGHPQKLIDWDYRAIHLTNLFAKEMIRAYYGSGPRRSYFQGCSDGGHEALMEALRYPADYDGIISGAPASPWTRTMTDFVSNYQALSGAPDAKLTDGDLKLVHSAVLARCDALDGVKDGIVSDPQACNFNPAVLLCKSGQRQGCLNDAQVRAIRKIYQGLRVDGVQISSGFEPGSELDWNPWIIGPNAGDAQFGIEFYRWIVYKNPNWTPTGSDIARDFADAEQRTGRMLNSDSPDLRAFVRRGGKLLLYQGWADPVIPPANIITYYDALTKELGAKADQVRLFMVPGMSHCFLGGAGPNVFDTLDPLDHWVERGVAPERLIATKYDNDAPSAKALMTRPLCAWPKRARWTGSGSISDAASFVCAAPQGPDPGVQAGSAAPAVSGTSAAAYPNMAPIAQYQSVDQAAEIALARSAAPASISGRAEILALGKHGYETAVKGSNGFVCLVSRSWDLNFNDPEFWNPKIRSAQCFNAAGANSVLRNYLERTRRVLAGESIASMRAHAKSHKAAPGSVCYMMSKQAYLNDTVAGPWYSHVMFFGLEKPADWGANLPDSPVRADAKAYAPVTIFMVIVQKWSDGTPSTKESARGM